MGEKRVNIRADDGDSVQLGDVGGNLATVTDLGGGKKGIDVSATLPSGSTVEAIIKDVSGNKVTTTDLGGGVRGLDANQVKLDHTTDSVIARAQDGTGNALSSTGGKLDVNQIKLDHTSDSVISRNQDGSGNALSSTAGKLDVNQIKLDHANDSVTSRSQDGAGNALTSTAVGGDQALDANISGGNLEVYEGYTNPNLTFLFAYVQAGDIGVDYVAGSVGMTKTMKVYPSGAAGGTPAKLTTYKYKDSTQPNGVTEAAESSTTV